MQVVICYLVFEGCSNCSSDGEFDCGNYLIGGIIGSFKFEILLSDIILLLWLKINVKVGKFFYIFEIVFVFCFFVLYLFCCVFWYCMSYLFFILLCI